MKNIFVILILLTFQIQAQSIEEVLKKVQEKNTSTNYKVNLKYQLYKGLKGTKLIEEFNGVLIKNKNNFYNKIHHTETVTTNKFYIKVNHDEKAIIFSEHKIKPQKNIMFDFGELLKQFENPKISEQGKYWIIEMITKEFSQLPYSKISLKIDKESYLVNKQVLILSRLTDFSKDTEIKNDFNLPKIEMVFEDYKEVTEIDLNVFDKNKYVLTKNNKIVTSQNLKNYDIIN